MTKPFIRILTLLVFVLFMGNLNSQVTGYWIQVVEEHTGIVDGFDLTGYTTYDLYLTTENCDNDLTTIQSSGLSCPEDDTTLFFHFGDCGVFQHPDLGPDSWSTFCNLAYDETNPLYQESYQYDTYVTIGSECFGQGGTIALDLTCPAGAVDVFEGDVVTGDPFDGGDLDIEVGFYGTFGSDTNTQAEELPCAPQGCGVKILRFTTCSDMSQFDFCLTALVIGELGVEVCAEDGDTDPCDLLDATWAITDSIDCFGDVATVEFGTGADEYGPYTYEIVDANTDIPIDTVDVNTYTGLEAGNDYYFVITNCANCDDTTSICSIPDVELFETFSTVTQDILCAGDAGEICYEIAGGTPGFTAQLVDEDGMIYNPVAGVDPFEGCFEDLPCGIYTLEVEDNNGCVASDMDTITCVTQITTDLVDNDLLCFQDSSGTILGTAQGGTGEFYVVWTDLAGDTLLEITGTPDPELDISIEDLHAGEYFVNITDENGCEANDDFIIGEPELLTITLDSTNVSCAGLCDGTISPSASGGTGSYSFSCDDGEDELCAGTYECIVTDDNGCTASDSVMIVEPLPIIFDFEFTTISCAEDCDASVTLSNFVGGTGDVEISIEPNNGVIINNYPVDISITELCSGTYTVTIADNDGACEITQEVFIPEPDPLVGIIEVSDVSCFGFGDGEVDIDCTGAQGDVLITGIGDDMQLCPSNFSDLEAGIFNITLTDTAGCIYMETVEVSEPDTLVLSVLGIEQVSCGGVNDGGIDAESTGGSGVISWYLNEEGPMDFPGDLDGLPAGDYDILIVDEAGCEAEASVSIIEPDPIVVLELIDQITCTGMTDGSAILTLSGGTPELELDFASPEPDFEVDGDIITLENLPEGDYPYVVTDSEGCVFLDTLSMTPEFISDIEYQIFTTPVTCWNEDDGTATVALTGGIDPITYQWNDPEDQTTNVAVGLTNDTYLVTIEDGQGCIITDTVTIEMNIGCFFIADALSPNGDGYNDGWVIGGLEFFPNSKVQVFNRWGQLLFESTGYPTMWDGTFDGNKLPMADYYYIITYDPNADPILGTVTIKY